MNAAVKPASDTVLSPLVRVPRHVAIIMDGNGRWAKERGLPRVAGHRAGTENLRLILRAAVEFGVQVLTIYAFSSENWTRPRAEIEALMAILEGAIADELDELHRNGVCVRHLGRVEGLSGRLVTKIRSAEQLTRDNCRLYLNVALNYGGRADIVDAVKALMREGVAADAVTEEAISAHLSTRGLPDPDLVIRTAGEMRLSNFLVWQASYAEYYASPVYWPDFGREELHKALLAYQQRDRRYGGLPNPGT